MTTATANPSELLTTEEAAAFLGCKPQTLNAWRSSGRYGLRYRKVGHLVRYNRADLERWLETRGATSTAAAHTR